MAKKKSFYEVSSYTGSLREGREINVQRHIMYQGENADFTPFLEVPHKELETRLKDSIAEEKKIFDELQTAIKAWDEHGAHTLLLQKAIEYIKTPPVKHTANVWKQQKDGAWEISNLVYKMTFKITRQGDEWKLAWELQYTAPGLPQNHYYSPYDDTPRKRIEYEGSKKYKTLDGAQKYIQGKFDQYSACFDALSPPVPEAVKSLFCVNGQLLQGYSVARPGIKKKKEATVDDLLAYLEGGDATPALEQSPSPPEQAATPPASEKDAARPVQKPTRHTARRSSHKKTRPAPAR